MTKMVSRILEQKEAIHLVLSADRDTSNIVPTWQDLDVLQAILETDLLKVQEVDTQLTKDIGSVDLLIFD